MAKSSSKSVVSFESWAESQGIDLAEISGDFSKVKAARQAYTDAMTGGPKRTYTPSTHVLALVVTDDSGDERIVRRMRNVTTRGQAEARDFLLSLHKASGGAGEAEVLVLSAPRDDAE